MPSLQRFAAASARLTVPVSAHRLRGVWRWPLRLDRLDGDERVELLNRV